MTMAAVVGRRRMYVLPARVVMWLMLWISDVSNYSIRYSLPLLVHEIVREFSLGLGDRALLLSAFYPLYTLLQLPGALICKGWNTKQILGAVIWGNALLTGLLPRVAGGRHPVGALWRALLLLGVIQAPMVPGREMLKAVWCPPGPERALSLHIVAFGITVTSVATPVLLTWLCSARGWRAACTALSSISVVSGVIWQLGAANGPSDYRWSIDPAEVKLLEPAESAMMVVDKRVPTAVLSIGERIQGACAPFRSAAVFMPMLVNITSTSCASTIMSFAPVVFTETLGSDTARAGKAIGLGSLAQFLGQCLGGALEAQLLRSGVGLLRIRKIQMACGAAGMSVAMVLFSLAQTMREATLCVICYWLCSAALHNQALNSNYLEVSGGNAGTVRAIGNTICQIGQIGGPFVGAVIRRSTGVWWPHFATMGALNILTALLFARWAGVEPPA